MNTYGQTITLHLAGFLSRRARTTSAPPPPPPPPFSVLPATVTATPEMKLTRTDSMMECRLEIVGVLDVHSAPELRAEFDSVVSARPQHVVIDLAALTMLDSSGVGAIVSLFKRVKTAGGTFAVLGVKGQPLAVFRLLSLDRVFGL
jgi:anti-sigma B factor antagonist